MGDRLIVTLSRAAGDASALRLVELIVVVLTLIPVITGVAVRIQRRRETAKAARNKQ